MNPDCTLITEKQIKDFIILSTTQGDPCLVGTLRLVIDEIWRIGGLFACSSPVEQYLEVRLKVIQLLMSCAAKQFDTKDTFTESFQTGESNTRSDGFAQAQAGNQGFRVNDSASCAQYDDFAKAKMRSASARNAKGCSRDNSFSTYTDQGGGKNRILADATRFSKGGTTVTSSSQAFSTTIGGSARKGCNYTISEENGEGGGSALPVGAVLGLVNTSLATSYSSSYSSSTWRHHMSDASSSRQKDERTGSSKRTYGRDGVTDNKGLSVSCSFFNAQIFSDAQGTSRSRNADDSDAFRNEDAHAEGLGTSFSKADARGEVSAQGSSKAHEDGSSKRDSSRNNRTVGDSIYRSQIYKNLKEMHGITLQNLEYVAALGRARQSPVWTGGICQIVRDGHCDIKLWMLQRCGYLGSLHRHPYPIRDCCDSKKTNRISGGQIGGFGSVLCGTTDTRIDTQPVVSGSCNCG